MCFAHYRTIATWWSNQSVRRRKGWFAALPLLRGRWKCSILSPSFPSFPSFKHKKYVAWMEFAIDIENSIERWNMLKTIQFNNQFNFFAKYSFKKFFIFLKNWLSPRAISICYRWYNVAWWCVIVWCLTLTVWECFPLCNCDTNARRVIPVGQSDSA